MMVNKGVPIAILQGGGGGGGLINKIIAKVCPKWLVNFGAERGLAIRKKSINTSFKRSHADTDHVWFSYDLFPRSFPDKPVYLSMLRDPVSRLESHFYFMRHGDKDMSKEEVLKSLGPKSALPNEVNRNSNYSQI